MWNFKTLKLTNFMSHKSSEFSFNDNLATMICGINNSDEGQKSNGSGKSSILEGIAVGVLGDSLKKLTPKDLIHNGEKESNIFVELHNSKTNDSLVIDRTFYLKKSSILDIYLNNKKLDNYISVTDGNKMLLEIIRISKEDLLNYFLISKKKYKSFLSSSDSVKKDIIGRFSNYNQIDFVFDIIKSEIKEFDNDIIKVDNELSKLEGSKETYLEEIENLKNDTSEDKDNQIKNVEDKIKGIEKDISNIQEKEIDYLHQMDNNQELIKELDVEITSLNEEKDKINKNIYDDKIDSLNNDIKDYRKQLSKNNEIITENNQLVLSFETLKKEAIECPKCEHTFSVNDNSEIDLNEIDEGIELAKVLIQDFKDLNQSIEGNIKSKKEDIRKVEIKIEKINKQERELRNKISEKENLKSKRENEYNEWSRKIDSNNELIKDYEKKILVQKELIEDIKNKDNSQIIKDYEKKIKDIDKEFKSVEKIKEEVISIQNNKKELDVVFTKFKTYLSNKVIKVLEHYVNEYLNKMKSNIEVQIDGYKENRDGSIRDKITINILRDGMFEGNFEKFSEGEKGRVEVAFILSLQKLINQSVNSGGLNLCFLDEVIESIDSEGISLIMKVLNDLNQTIIVITHGTFESTYDNIVNVVKENGYSTITYE